MNSFIIDLCRCAILEPGHLESAFFVFSITLVITSSFLPKYQVVLTCYYFVQHLTRRVARCSDGDKWFLHEFVVVSPEFPLPLTQSPALPRKSSLSFIAQK